MLAAAFWGFFAAGSLLLGAALALWRPWSARAIGLVMAFGTGVLFSSVAFDLVEDALENGGGRPTSAGIAAGAAAYFVGDMLVSRRGGAGRKSALRDDGSTETDEAGDPAAIVVGAVLDGIPESVAIGISLLGGGHVGGVFVAAVFMSNVPEALSASAGLSKQGRPAGRIIRMWAIVVAVSTLASLAGYALLDGTSVNTIAFLSAFAAGAVLTMLASTMVPEAAREGGPVSGLVTTGGFLLAVLLDYAA
ncbi:MAG: ZIP family metal transporter [Acidimicrobiales bacterium]